MKRAKNFFLNNKIWCIFFIVLIQNECLAQQYGPYYYTDKDESLSISVDYISNLWSGSDAVNITVKNTGTTSIDMKNAILVFSNSTVAPSFNTFTLLGPLGWPDFTVPPRTVVDDVPNSIYVDTITKYASGNTWSNTILAPNQSFTCQYTFNNTTVSTTFLQTFSSSLKIYPSSWTPPVFFVPVTFNFTGNDGNKVTAHALKTSTNTTTDYTMINSGTSEQLRTGNQFSIWADNFVVGNTQYISTYTSSSPFSFTSPSGSGVASSVSLPFTTQTIPTGSFTVLVSGLTDNSTVLLTLNGKTYNTSKSYTVTNGTLSIDNIPLDTYTISAGNYFNSSTNIVAKAVYNTQYSLSTTNGSTLKVTYTSCNIIPYTVPGFPKYIAQGGITINETGSTFTRTPMDVLFKYSGNAGDGDPGKVWDLNADIQGAIIGTIAQCRKLEQTYKSMYSFLPSDYTVLPLMVHYTANMSGGWTVGAVEMLDTTHLRYHFINLIRETQEFMKNKDAKHPFPGSFIISPDMLGMLEQNYGGINSSPVFDYNNPSKFGSVQDGYSANLFTSKIFVNEKLADAYTWCGLNASSLPTFTNDIKGYFQALTYIVHAVSNNSVTVGYQENMWATGGAQWVTDHSADPVTQANTLVNFVNTKLGIFNGTYKPDYLVLDRYEMDDFGGGIGNYCYNATSWQRTLDYGTAMAKGFGGLQWMLWQFPGGHLVPANGSEPVVNYDPVTHGGAGGTWIFGDNNIGTNINNISTQQLNLTLSPATYQGATTVKALFNLDGGYDWGKSQLDSLAARNVFAILWGGGNTTSITHVSGNGDDDGWLASRVKNYLNGNQTFKTICPMQWTGGTSTDWNTASNWNVNSVPTSTNNVVIASGTTYSPTITTQQGVNNLTVFSDAALTINGGVLNINGSISNSGKLDVSKGTIAMTGTSAQTIPASVFQGDVVQNLTINNTAGVTLGGILNVTGIVKPSNGLLTTGGYLTLKSSANGTASIATGTGTYISGDVTVERYIPSHTSKSYTLVSSPINSPTIYESWQENGASIAGYGTQITGANSGSGFDAASAAAIPSIYNYNDNNAAGTKWVGLTNTNNNLLGVGTGYLLFVRGDRTIMPGGTGVSGATTLRAKGALMTGTVSFATSGGTVGTPALTNGANKYSLISNPYPSTIDWTSPSIIKTNLASAFTVYDPNLGTFVSSDGTTVSPSISQQQAKYIQSGQAFFIQNAASGVPGLIITENAKVTGTATNTSATVFGGGQTIPVAQLNVNVYKESNNAFVDGVVAVFSSEYSKELNAKDADKFKNFGETVSFTKQQKELSIVALPVPQISDTLWLNMQNMDLDSEYQLKIDGAGWKSNNIKDVILIDNKTLTQIPVDLNIVNQYTYTSLEKSEKNRMMIVFNNKKLTGGTNDSNDSGTEGLTVKILGNPVTDLIELSFVSKQVGKALIRVISTDGQVLEKIDLGEQQLGIVRIPVKNYGKGIYVVEVSVGSRRVIERIMKN